MDKIAKYVVFASKQLALLNVLVDADLRDEEASIACARANKGGPAGRAPYQ